MRFLALSSCVWLLGFAEPTCTPPLTQGTPAEPAQTAEAAEAAEAEDPGACLASCVGGAKLSETDRETCRLLCQPDTVRPKRTATLLARFELCESRCEPQGKSNSATCVLNCSEAAMSSLKLSTQSRGCLGPCLEEEHTCRAQCRGESETNIETCRIQCSQVAKACADACDSPPG